MIQIDFQEPQDDTWKNWRIRCQEKQTELIATVQRGEKPRIDDRLYKEQKSIYISKDGPFANKCAYCETSLHAQHGDLDHFRPKADLRNEDGSPVMIEEDGRQTLHQGYYWLAYDWRNLLPACQKCNQPSKDRGGKRSYFPIEGDRAFSPSHELEAEKPLLIHPVLEDPAEHLAVDIDSGQIISLTKRGKACIRIFGLDNDILQGERLEAIRKTRVAYQQAKSQSKRHFSRVVKQLMSSREEYALACRTQVKTKLKELLQNP